VNGFFDLKAVTTLPDCARCQLTASCHSPKVRVHGGGQQKILIVAGSPDFSVDRSGDVTTGGAFIYLQQLLEQYGLVLTRDCWWVHAVSCHSSLKTTEEWIECCRPIVRNALESLSPRMVFLLGHTAIKSVIGGLSAQNVSTANNWYGWQIPEREHNMWICPLPDPEWISEKTLDRGRAAYFTRLVEHAVQKQDRPYSNHHDLAGASFNRVQIMQDCNSVAQVLSKMIVQGTPVAFDYETTGLKPDREGHRVLSVGVSDGVTTIAFPMNNAVQGIWVEFLQSAVPKIAANLKFEETWSRVFFGTPVSNWFWDTMLYAHVLDNREGIVGLKFQAYVNFGIDGYDASIQPYIKSRGKGANAFNTMESAPLFDLLQYNGMDALLEWKLWSRQSGRESV